MSALLKSGSIGSAVRGVIETPPPTRGELLELEEMRLRARIADLERELVLRTEMADAVPLHIEAARAEGWAGGHAQGLLDASDRQDARLDALDDACRAACETVAGGLAALEKLSLLLARDALELVFDDARPYTESAAAIIRKQMTAIEREAVLRIRVSSADFPDAAALESLAKVSGVAQTIFEIDAAMISGECTMSLRLGEVDIGIGRQSEAVLDALTGLARAEMSS